MDFLFSYKKYMVALKALFRTTNYPDLVGDLGALLSVVLVFRLMEKLFEKIHKKMDPNSLLFRIYNSPFMYIFPVLRAIVLFAVCGELKFVSWIDSWLSAYLYLLIVFRVCCLLVNLSPPIVSRIVDSKFGSVGDDIKNPLSLLVRVSIWSVGGVLFLDGVGLSVSALITGLGVGGLAIAFASQRLLGDIFNFFVLSLDAPFQVGDVIKMKDWNGRVEHIGVKTTRVRSVSGEVLIITNSDLTSECIQNFRKMEERRAVVNFIVSPTVSVDKLKSIPCILRNIVTDEPRARFDRAWLQSVHGSGWTFEFVFYVESASYEVFASTNHEILMAMLDSFDKQQIHIRYP